MLVFDSKNTGEHSEDVKDEHKHPLKRRSRNRKLLGSCNVVLLALQTLPSTASFITSRKNLKKSQKALKRKSGVSCRPKLCVQPSQEGRSVTWHNWETPKHNVSLTGTETGESLTSDLHGQRQEILLILDNLNTDRKSSKFSWPTWTGTGDPLSSPGQHEQTREALSSDQPEQRQILLVLLVSLNRDRRSS